LNVQRRATGSRHFLADGLADGKQGDHVATGKRTAARLHLLTAREVQNAPDGDHADGGGLLLRVRPGSVSWVFRFTAPSGRRREMGLGVAPRGSTKQAGETLDAARRAAHAAREILRQGLDPIDHREQQRAHLRETENARREGRTREHWTLARAGRDFHERIIEPTRTGKHAAQWIASLENHVAPAVWHKPLGDITAPELLSALLEVRPHERARNLTSERLQETVGRLRQRLDAIFEDAIFHGRCSSNPAAAIKRKLREGMPRQKAGEFKALPYREAPALMRRLREAEGTAARCLEFAILSAARTSEALAAGWKEIDLEGGVWTVPPERMKANEEHIVFLSARAIEVLKVQRELQRGPLVFPSTMPGRERQPLSNMAMLAVLDRLGMREQTTVHGLCRATFSTWANETSAARPDVIEACLAHGEQDKVRAAYNRAKFTEERRALLGKWAEYLNQPAAQVIALSRAA
jgi:integrase